MRKTQVWVAMMLDGDGKERRIVQFNVSTEEIVQRANAFVATNQAHFGSVVIESNINATLMQWTFLRPDGKKEFLQLALVSKASLPDFDVAVP